MKEIKNIGYIYKITNLVNGKVYIGQTIQTIKSRWKSHKVCSKQEDKMRYALYRAMNKYGIENFTIEEIEKCEIDKLNEREVYWIDFYDSFNSNKGYNLTLGGEGAKIYNLDENLVLKQFKELDNVTQVAKIYGCSPNVIKEILNKHQIHIKSQTEKGFSAKRYSLNGDFIESYNSLCEASSWIKNNIIEAKFRDISNISFCLKTHICQKTPYYGFIWISDDISRNMVNDFILNEKERRKEICPICNVNKKSKASYSCYSCYLKSMKKDENIKNKKIIKNIEKKEIFTNCKNCGIEIKFKKEYCPNCARIIAYQIKKEKFMKELKNKISKETLMQLVREKSFIEIGNIYGVSDSSIKKWCKNYSIPFKKEDIKNISDENWKKECSLSKEEYEKKYINGTKKIFTDQEIIDKYLEIKNITYLEKFFHKDKDSIKKILIDNGINLSDISKKRIIKVQKLNTSSMEILNEFSSVKEAIQYVLDNKLSNTLKENVIREAISQSNSKGRVSYGYLWKFIYEE